MYYNTYTEQPNVPQFLWKWNQKINLEQAVIQIDSCNRYVTKTVRTLEEAEINRLPHNTLTAIAKDLFISPLEELKQKKLLPNTQYYEFNIPKSSGGFRTITAPSPILKTAQKKIVEKLINLELFPHNAVHSYMPGRGTQTALKVHQNNHSKWFLKLDIKNFFPSITINTIRKHLDLYANVAYLTTFHVLTEDLERFYKTLCYKNSLPQGSPASPYISNLVLLQFDLELANYLQQMGYMYTRYADDLLISSQTEFKKDKKQIIDTIQFRLHQLYGMQLNDEKIRYGSSSGKNWNLGLMLNKDNNVTIGHKKKQKLKITLHKLYTAHLTGTVEQEQAYKVFGQLAYFKKIEPDYADYVLTKYENKFNISLAELHKRYG